jgi:hypothetical protein
MKADTMIPNTLRDSGPTFLDFTEFGAKHPVWMMEDGRLRPDIRGAADGAPSVPVVDPFLLYARTQPLPVQIGTLAAGDPGGQATSLIAWNPNNIAEVPGWAQTLDLHITLPVELNVAAGATVTMSPLAPYSALAVQMLLSGSPEWPQNTSLVPWWLDDITNFQIFDPFMAGPSIRTTNGIPNDVDPEWYDAGPDGPTFAGGANTILPGGTQAGGVGGVTRNYVVKFTCRINLQRLRTKMWGMIPLGDPQNRPVLRAQLSALLGFQPENNLFIDDAANPGSTAAVDTGGVEVVAVFRTKSLDYLPQGLQIAQPQVGLGLNLVYDNSFAINNAGAIQFQGQRTAMVYTAIHHLLVNNSLPIRGDYFGLWVTQNAQSARWAYDESAGTMQDYYTDVLNRYKRYLPQGHYVADLQNGEFPDIPRETPYIAQMSPDVAYAASVGVAATPNMSTAVRIPAGTALVDAYLATYAFGLVRVPY